MLRFIEHYGVRAKFGMWKRLNVKNETEFVTFVTDLLVLELRGYVRLAKGTAYDEFIHRIGSAEQDYAIPLPTPPMKQID